MEALGGRGVMSPGISFPQENEVPFHAVKTLTSTASIHLCFIVFVLVLLTIFLYNSMQSIEQPVSPQRNEAVGITNIQTPQISHLA